MKGELPTLHSLPRKVHGRHRGRKRERGAGCSLRSGIRADAAMANIAVQRIKREFKEVLKSEEVCERRCFFRHHPSYSKPKCVMLFSTGDVRSPQTVWQSPPLPKKYYLCKRQVPSCCWSGLKQMDNFSVSLVSMLGRTSPGCARWTQETPWTRRLPIIRPCANANQYSTPLG